MWRHMSGRRPRTTLRRRRHAGPGTWAALDEAGDADGDPFIAYRRLEADPATGRGVLVETRPDDSFVGVTHEVRLMSVDPLTGELTVDSYDYSWESLSAPEREKHVAALRSNL